MIACVDCAYYRASDPTARDLCIHPDCTTQVPDYVHGLYAESHLGVRTARDPSGACTPDAVLFKRIVDTRSSLPGIL